MQLKRNIFFSFCILLACQTFGQDTSRYLKTIPVFAQKDTTLKLAVITATIPHYELKLAKLDELGAADVGDALKYVPGVQLRDYGGIGGIKTVSFRSLGAGHTTVQMDGNYVPNVQSGVINLSSFELFGLEKVSFSTGRAVDLRSSATAYLQANTIALNSILASQPTKFRLGFYSNTTSINAYENGGLAQARLGKRFFVGGQFLLRHGSGAYPFYHPEEDGTVLRTRANTALFNYRWRTLLGYDHGKTKVTASLSFNDNEQELPGAAVLFNASNDQKLWNKDWRANLNHSFKNGKWTWQNHVDFNQNYTRYFDPHHLSLLGFIDVDYQQRNFASGSILSKSFRFPAERVFIGTDVIASSLLSETVNGNPNRLQSNSVIGGATLFGKFKLDANVTTQFIFDRFDEGVTVQERNYSKLSPFVSIGYSPLKKANLRLRTFFKNTFRMPTFNDLYYNFIGNTNLLPEDANLFNLGVTYGIYKKRWTAEFSADAYFNRVRNKIVAIPTKDLFNWSMQNIGSTDIRGVDLGGLISFSVREFRITANTNHSLNESIDVTDPSSETYGSQIPYTPYYSSSNGLNVTWKGYGFSSNVLISGFRFSLNENNYANLLPGFVDLNLGLSKKFIVKSNAFFIDLKVQNLLNKNYQVIRSFPMPGRYYQLRIKYTINK
jgi:outer membrane receptor protein involved in Fe transport